MKSNPSLAARHWAPLIGFLRSSATGGLMLVAAAIAALLWSNSPAAPAYHALLAAPLGPFSLLEWVNEGLMALFFLQVGLEIRREMVEGELASLRRVAAPGLAALGGMIAPALLYILLNHRDPAALRGWAIPVATDIAFSLAALGLLGSRVPVALKVFLTALAILDDLGAVVVIALFYGTGLEPRALAAAAAILAALWGLSRLVRQAIWPYLLGGAVLWVAVLHSGIHATLAGVALAFAMPLQDGPNGSPAKRLEHALGPVIAYLVLPLFGLFNAGLSFGQLSLGVLVDPVFLGIAGGLVVGKQLGVFCATWVATKLGLARLPPGLTWPILHGGALLCGIGFTMSLFIGNLAFPAADRMTEVKLATFTASLVSAALGLLVLRLATPAKHRVATP